MEHQYLPQPYSAFLPQAKNDISREAVLAEKAIVLARPIIQRMSIIKLIAFFDYHTLGLLGMADRLKDSVSKLRDQEIVEAQSKHVTDFGSLTADDNDKLILTHQDYCARVVLELDRHLDFLLGGLISVIADFVPDPMVAVLRKAPLLALKNGVGNHTARLDGFSIGVLAMLLLLGTMHAGAALITAGEPSHALVFLMANWGVMAIRFFDLILRSRNGQFEKGLRYIEWLISAVLIGLILNHCGLQIAGSRAPQTIHRVINEVLLGAGTVLVFHKLVWLLVRRLRDWKDRGKRMW